MASRPSPLKPYERARLSSSMSGGPVTPVSVGSSSRPLSSSLTSGYTRPPMREEFARARASNVDSYGGAPSSYSSSSSSPYTSAPRPPPRPWESSSRMGYGGSSYGGMGGYGGGYGGYGGSDYYPGRYSSPYGYGGGGGLYGGGGSYLNPYSRDPKYLMGGEPGFPNAIESHFGWVNDFGRIVDTFARISWLLDMNLETIFGSFNAMLRFFDRIRFMNLAELAPMVQAMVFLAGLGVAGAKLAELLKGRKKSDDMDIALFEQQFSGGAGATRKRSKHLWTFVLLGLFAAFLGTPLLFRLIAKLLKRDGEKPDSAAAPLKLRAIYDFEPETREDLPLRAGDIVEVVRRRDGSGWVEAKLNGRFGLVPQNYLEPLDATAAEQEMQPLEEMDRQLLRSSAPSHRRIEEITS